jgi:hypothetical protein
MAEQSGMKPINVEILMGHSVGISDSYYRPTEQSLGEDYLKAVDKLTVSSNSQTMVKLSEPPGISIADGVQRQRDAGAQR